MFGFRLVQYRLQQGQLVIIDLGNIEAVYL
jgi:hypothetical protein